jgi:hypothetical protein
VLLLLLHLNVRVVETSIRPSKGKTLLHQETPFYTRKLS